MRLELIKRTVEAMVEMDMAAVERLATIADELAELFPKRDEDGGIDYLTLMDQMRILIQASSASAGYSVVQTSKAPDLPARSLFAYSGALGMVGAN